MIVEFGSALWYYLFINFLRIIGEIAVARPKKNGTYLNVCIETPIYERLVAFSNDAGQTKTVAVERALTLYFDEYEEKQRRLSEISEDK